MLGEVGRFASLASWGSRASTAMRGGAAVFGVAWIAAAALLGCAEQQATQVLVHFDAEPALRAEAMTLRVRVFDLPAGAVRYDEARTVGGASPQASFPATVPVVPRDGDAGRRFRVLGELTDGSDVVISTVMTEEGFTAHTLREVTLVFARDAGDGGSATDAGVDAGEGRDAGDAGSTDAPSCPTCPCSSDLCVAGACVPSRRIAHVGAGGNSTCAIDDEGALLCFGANDVAQLGLGAASGSVLVPTVVPERILWTGSSTSMIEPLPPLTTIDPSTTFMCAIDLNGAPHCWGRNDRRQLGLGPCCSDATLDQTRPTPLRSGGMMRVITTGQQHACGISESMRGRLYCWGRNDDGKTSGTDRTQYAEPRPVDYNDDWLDVSAGDAHTCAIRTLGPGGLYCFGRDSEGRLGQSFGGVDQATPQRVPGSYRYVSAGSRHTCAITLDGHLLCFGRNAEGQLGVGDTTFRQGTREVDGAFADWVQVSAGYTHTCGIRDGDRLFCWGTNLTGELGVPSVTGGTSTTPVEVGAGYVQVSAGESYTCAVTTEGRLHCFGSGASGELGTGDTADQPSPALLCFD